MDQESFRQLLQTTASKSGAPPRASAAALASSNASKGHKTKKAGPSEPAFKPRAVKKHDAKYRDRAEERRLGVGNDYAQVEALAEDFEKRNADKDRATLEEQRRYLGGDSEHTVLVKGLDFALLEQNKARAGAATEDDDLLEQAFEEAQVTLPKKRTRDEIIQQLKSKRQKHDGTPEAASSATPEPPIAEAKNAGKFKPIGFKPIGQAEGSKKKKVKTKGKAKAGEEGSKKKKATVKTEVAQEVSSTPAQQPGESSTSKASHPPPLNPAHEPEPLDEDFDIFAGAGEYTGVDLGDDDEDSAEEGEQKEDEDREHGADEIEPRAKGKWFDTGDEPQPAARSVTPPPATSKSPVAGPSHDEKEEGEEEEEEEAHARLVPLSSSAMPSIREYLAMEAEAEKEEKRRARKEKKKREQ